MAKNVLNIQFLRSNTIFETRESASAALESNKGLVADGSALLARYSGETATDVKTLVGFVWSDGTNHAITIFDVEGTSDEIEKLRTEINNKLGDGVTSANTATAQLAALSGSTADTSATTSVEGAKRYADDKISDTIGKLDYSGVTTGDAVVITNVTEADGVVSATSANVGGLKLTGYEQGSVSGAVASTDTINEAFGKVENQIDAINSVVDDLDGTISAETGYYINKVDEVNGKISGTTAALPTVAAISEAGKPITAVSESLGEISATAGTINAEFVTVADTGSVFTATDVEGVLAEIDAAYKQADSDLKDEILGDATDSGDTLGKLEDRIEGLEEGAATYTIRKDTTGLPAEIKERYTLVETKDGQSTDKQVTIDVPKDSHIVSITYITNTGDTHYQNLEYVYIDVSGNTQTTYVDMSELVLETEFASGVTVTDHIAHGVVDSTSEKDSQSTPADFLTVGAGGFKVSGIKDEIDRKIAALDNTSDAAVEGQYITYITETDGIVSVGGREDIADAPLNGYTKGSDASGVTATDTINEAISKLENQIDAAESAATAAATVIASGSSADTTEHLEIVTTTDQATNAKTYTFNLKDVASQTDLAALSAKTLTEVGSSNSSISATTAAASDGTVSVDLVTDASKVKMTGFTAGDSGFTAITTASTVTEAVKAIETEFLANEQTTAQALNDLEETKLENIIVNGVTGTTGANNTASVTIDGGDVVLGADYVKPSSGSAIATGDTVDEALGKLEAKVDAATSGGITGATVNNAPLAITNNVLAQTVVGKQSEATATSNEAIVVETDASGNLTLGLANLDAGTY